LKLLAFFKIAEINGVKTEVIDKIPHLSFCVNVITSYKDSPPVRVAFWQTVLFKLIGFVLDFIV
jgi:hypothetical protein